MPVTSWLRVKNWDRFQHYKDRSPPWIKLHYSTLDDYAWSHLPDASKAHLMGIWLLASRNDGRVPNDAAWLGKRIGARSKVDMTVLVRAGFLERDASTSAEQDASEALDLEEKRREETEKRREEADSERELFGLAWKDYPRRPNDSRANALRAWTARRNEGVDAGAMHDGVKRYAAYCRRERTEPKYIKQGATFFGPGRHWESDYSSAAAPKPQAHEPAYHRKYVPPEVQHATDERVIALTKGIGVMPTKASA